MLKLEGEPTSVGIFQYILYVSDGYDTLKFNI